MARAAFSILRGRVEDDARYDRLKQLAYIRSQYETQRKSTSPFDYRSQWRRRQYRCDDSKVETGMPDRVPYQSESADSRLLSPTRRRNTIQKFCTQLGATVDRLAVWWPWWLTAPRLPNASQSKTARSTGRMPTTRVRGRYCVTIGRFCLWMFVRLPNELPFY
jgi:hypothetical protein